MVTKSVRDLQLHIASKLGGKRRVQEGLWAIWNPYTHQFGSLYQSESDAKDVARRTHLTLDVVKVRVEEM